MTNQRRRRLATCALLGLAACSRSEPEHAGSAVAGPAEEGTLPEVEAGEREPGGARPSVAPEPSRDGSDERGAPPPAAELGGLSAAPCNPVSTRPLPLDAVSPLGFAPEDVLPFAIGEHRLPVEWLGVPPGEESSRSLVVGSSELSLELAVIGDEARVIDFDACVDAVEVDVSVGVSSDDGVLQERLDGVLDLRAGVVRLTAELSPAAIRGRFAFNPPAVGPRAPAGLTLDVDFTRYGLGGMLVQNYAAGDDVRRRQGARWPAGESCTVRRGTTPLTDDRDALVAAALERVQGPGSVMYASVDGAAVASELRLAAVPGSACFTGAGLGGAVLDGERDELNVLAELTLSSSALPGPLTLPIEVIGQFLPGTATLESARLSLGISPCAASAYSPEEFVTRCGDWGIDGSGYAGIAVRVDDSRFDASGGYAHFELQGLLAPGCVASPEGLVCAEGSTPDVEIVELARPSVFHEPQ